MKTIFSIALFLALIAAAVKFYGDYGASSQEIAFRTALVERGDLIQTVEATGTLEIHGQTG
jgi:multidrug efflux pump subunit AcrA (membrane-fusion protein)